MPKNTKENVEKVCFNYAKRLAQDKRIKCQLVREIIVLSDAQMCAVQAITEAMGLQWNDDMVRLTHKAFREGWNSGGGCLFMEQEASNYDPALDKNVSADKLECHLTFKKGFIPFKRPIY